MSANPPIGTKFVRHGGRREGLGSDILHRGEFLPSWRRLLSSSNRDALSVGAFRRWRTRGVDPLLKDSGRLEHENATGRDRRFLTGPGIAAHTLAFLAHHKRAERRELHRFAALQAVHDFFEHEFNECRAFGSQQADLLIDRLI